MYYVTLAMIIYDIIWILLFGNAWYMSDAKTEAWKEKSKIRGFCFLLYIVNLVVKVFIAKFTKQFSVEGSGREEDRSLMEDKDDVEEIPDNFLES